MSSHTRPNSGLFPRAAAEGVEPRILYFADTGVVAYVPPPTSEQVDIQLAQARAPVEHTQVSPNRLVVLDESLPQLDLLVAGPEQQREQGAANQVLLIDPDTDGLSDGQLTMSGTRADINAALATLTFTPATNYDGTGAKISATLSDGAMRSETDVITVQIVAATICRRYRAREVSALSRASQRRSRPM